jgi:ubiquinone/menaquinone biosynthesis C-methylase UbiE
MSSAVRWYDAHAGDLSRQYAELDPNQLYEWLVDLMPPSPSLVMDIGAGCGRDAVWSASKGHRVLAVKPSQMMLSEGEKALSGRELRWIQDSLLAKLPGWSGWSGCI